MRISTDRISHHYINKLTQSAPENKKAQRTRGDKNFDEVLISASSRQAEEKKVTEDLVQDVMSQVYRQAPPEKIESLCEAAAKGEYRVDSDAVARRMLLMKGEEYDG